MTTALSFPHPQPNQTIPQAGATVHVRVFDGESPDGQGRTLDSAPLYTITLGRAIRDMWNAKAYFTSVLIAGACVRCVRACVASVRVVWLFVHAPALAQMMPSSPHLHAVFAGAWPHIKSLASLLCWTLDGRRLSSNARRALMTLAYVLQKLSHVETFVLVRCLCLGDTDRVNQQIKCLAYQTPIPCPMPMPHTHPGDPHDGREPQGTPPRARRLGRPECHQAAGR